MAPAILKKYILCNSCLARQYSRKKSRNVNKAAGRCYICDGLMDKIDELLELIFVALKEYRYKTFLIGAVLPLHMLEHEDEIRAKFKIRGAENLKGHLTKELGKRVSETGKKVDYAKPDVTINIDVVKNVVTVRSRALFLFGRYLKRIRGLKQKQERCGICLGKGCTQCNKTGLSGFDSVEGIIVGKLINAFKCESAKFTWVGGEDKDSVVLNGGRPFFVKVVNPKLRFARSSHITENGVQVSFLKRLERLPDKPLKFKTKVKLLVECEYEISNSCLQKLNDLNNTYVRFSGKHGKEISRRIHKINAKASKNVLTIVIITDGGLAMKQFVNGNGMTPTISQIIGCEATCRSFDILAVKLTD